MQHRSNQEVKVNSICEEFKILNQYIDIFSVSGTLTFPTDVLESIHPSILAHYYSAYLNKCPLNNGVLVF